MKKLFLILIYSCLLIVGAAEKSFSQATCTCECLKPIFEYLIGTGQLFSYTANGNKILVSALISNANNAGYAVPAGGCDILTKNSGGYFYSSTSATTGKEYSANFGNCSVVLKSNSGTPINFLNLGNASCDNTGQISFVNGPHSVTKRYHVTRSAQVTYVYNGSSNYTIYPSSMLGYNVNFHPASMKMSWSTKYGKNGNFTDESYFSIDSLVNLPTGAYVEYAYLHLFAYPGGFAPPAFPNAHTPFSAGPYNTVGLWFLDKPWDSSKTNVFTVVQGSSHVLVPQQANDDVIISFADSFNRYGNRVLDNGVRLNVNQPGGGGGNYYLFDTGFIYQSYCSERYPDPAKRPYLDITWRTSEADTHKIAQLYIDSCSTCETLSSYGCYSAITDTSVNPYLYGLQGNWRPLRSYAYFSARNESDPTIRKGIRKAGTIKAFNCFWQLKNGVWEAQDTAISRWVWNSQTTLFNEKGAEMENKDPLGRYNAGLYGYGNTLATAVANNARYRQIAFDGFEDYNFSYGTCISCTPSRNFDFSSYKDNLDTTEQHTGRYSLRVAAGSTVGVAAVVGAENDTFTLSVNKGVNYCDTPGDSLLKSLKAASAALLPSFSPLAGTQILVSVWVKETGLCNDTAYPGNQVVVLMGTSANGNIPDTAKPHGNIIEGWQRYEIVVNVPADATSFKVSLQNTGANTVYFDDLRIHPYNANMKSYVYDEVTMRLMAELDENNYATFYEYDDDGSLVRLKKETERGIMTIKESRSGLLNE